MPSGFVRNAIVLGLLSAIGPFAIDMYLPALPSIATGLNASTAATQATLMAFFVSFGLCQIVYGPISDIVGRKPVLYVGLALFILASIGCGLSPSIHWLIGFRFLQGIGASVSMVIPRAVVRDLHTGLDATRLMSLVMLVFSVCPILAPLIGSGLIVPFGWRAVFAGVTVAASLGFLLVGFLLPETRPPQHRVGGSLKTVLNGYGRLLRDGHFLALTFMASFGMGSFFAFLASSSFIYIEHFGMTPTQYSFAFGINAVGFIGASQFSARLAARFGLVRVVATAIVWYAVMAALLFATTASGFTSLAVLMTLIFLAFAGLGLVIPTTMVLALDNHGPIAGMAAALGGALQMVVGAVIMAAVSAFFDGTALPMTATIALCAAVAFTLSRFTLRGERMVMKPAE
jgi:MFS transporter, DHA1 family, multidrug resistance protein